MEAKDFIKRLNEEGINYDLEQRGITDRTSIDMKDILNLSMDLEFGFKEMKINSNFEYIFSCSLDDKIKANCNYKAILFYNPQQHNQNITNLYYNIEKDIRECVAEIEKGGLFNTNEFFEAKIHTIVVEYENALNEIEVIKNDYYTIVEQKKQNYDFGCSVMKIENSYQSVKRADFLLGSQSFIKLAMYGQSLSEYRLGLIEDNI